MEMNHKLIVSKRIVIARPREIVWRVLTEPAYVKQYLYGADLLTDWVVGSPVRFRGEFEGQVWQDKGTVLACERPRHLRYSYYSGSCGLDDSPANYATVSFYLDEEVDGTLLAVEQQGYASEDSRATSERGWDAILSQIKTLAESD